MISKYMDRHWRAPFAIVLSLLTMISFVMATHAEEDSQRTSIAILPQAVLIAIDNLAPASGPPGTVVVLNGIGIGSNAEVLFADKTLPAEVMNSTVLRFTVPLDATCGESELQIKNLGPPVVLGDVMRFAVTSPCPDGPPGKIPQMPPQPPNEKPFFEVVSLDLPSTVLLGSTLTLQGVIENTGKASCIAAVQILVDGAPVDSGFVPLGMGNSIQVASTPYRWSTPGSHTVELRTQHKSMTKAILVQELPTNGNSPIQRFDIDKNLRIDDAEFFSIIDAWIAGQVDDAVFFQAVDLWISGQTISSVGLRSQKLSLSTLTLRAKRHTVTFHAHGQGIAAMNIEVFRLDGQRVFAANAAGKRLSWDLKTPSGEPVATGIYFYRVSVHGESGQNLRAEIQKLLVLR